MRQVRAGQVRASLALVGQALAWLGVLVQEPLLVQQLGAPAVLLPVQFLLARFHLAQALLLPHQEC